MTEQDKPQKPLMFAGQAWTPDDLRELFACHGDRLATSPRTMTDKERAEIADIEQRKKAESDAVAKRLFGCGGTAQPLGKFHA